MALYWQEVRKISTRKLIRECVLHTFFWLMLRLSLCLACFSFLEPARIAFSAEPMTWPRFDGPEQNRISRESRLNFQWPEETLSPPALSNLQLWTIRRLPGNSTPLVFNNKLYLCLSEDDRNGNVGDRSDFVSCWNIKDRDPEFVYQYRISNQINRKPSAKRNQLPVLVGDPLLRQLFCLTRQGELHVLDSDLGHLLWKKSLAQILGLQSPPDFVAPPLIFEQCLIIPASWYDSVKNRRTNQLLALDRRNGQVIWAIQGEQSLFEKLPAAISAIYQHQIIAVAQLEAGKIRLIQIRTGKEIARWNLADPQATARELLFESGRLAVLSSKLQQQTDNNNGALFHWWVDLFELSAGRDSKQSKNKMQSGAGKTIRLPDSHHATILLQEKSLFAINSESVFTEYDAVSGKKRSEFTLSEIEITSSQDDQAKVEKSDSAAKKKRGHVVHHLVMADRKLLVTSTSGLWCRVNIGESDENSLVKSISRQQVDPVITIPVISKGRIFVRQPDSLRAIGPIDNTVAVSSVLEPLSILAKERDSTTPGGIILTPGVQVLRPGWKQKFQVQLYNDRGAFLRLLKPEEIEWKTEGPGKFEKGSGVYFAPEKLAGDGENAAIKINASYQTFSAGATIKVRAQ